MENATEYRMLVFAERDPLTYPFVDLAQHVNGQWLSLTAGKTVEQLNEEAASAFLLDLETKGAAEYCPLKMVSLAHGWRICREHDQPRPTTPKSLSTANTELVKKANTERPLMQTQSFQNLA